MTRSEIYVHKVRGSGRLSHILATDARVVSTVHPVPRRVPTERSQLLVKPFRCRFHFRCASDLWRVVVLVSLRPVGRLRGSAAEDTDDDSGNDGDGDDSTDGCSNDGVTAPHGRRFCGQRYYSHHCEQMSLS